MSLSNTSSEIQQAVTNQNTHDVTSMSCDLLIVGAGLAGLTVALQVAQSRKVIVLAKRELTEAATAWAQGGIVGVLDEKDSFESHGGDTLEAGAGLVSEATARFINKRGRAYSSSYCSCCGCYWKSDTYSSFRKS